MSIRRIEVASAWSGQIEIDLPLRVRRIVTLTLNRIAKDWPQLFRITVKPGDPETMDNILATKSLTSIYLNPNYWLDKGKLDEHSKEWNEAVVDSSIAGVITHECGHILDNLLLRKLGTKKYNTFIGRNLRDITGIWNDESPSAYGQENVAEFMAESFSAFYLGRSAFSNDLGVKSLGLSKRMWTEIKDLLN